MKLLRRGLGFLVGTSTVLYSPGTVLVQYTLLYWYEHWEFTGRVGLDFFS